jgi:hypothetical protein
VKLSKDSIHEENFYVAFVCQKSHLLL